MERLLDTGAIRIEDRRAAWRSIVEDAFGMQIEFVEDRPSLDGGMWRTRLGPISVYETRLPFAHTVSKKNKPQQQVLLLRQDGGECRIEQGANEEIYRAGDIAVIDACRDFDGEMSGRGGGTWLTIPLDSTRRDIAYPLEASGLRIDGKSPAGSVASAFLSAFASQADSLSAAQATRLTSILMDLLSTAASERLGLSSTTSRSRRFLLRQARLHVENHLNDPSLSPSSVATHLGISKRYLTKLFQNQPRTLAELIRDRRLLKCRRDLIDGSMQHRSITDVAFSWGFSSVAHFSRAYKQHFGLTPSAQRAAGRR